MDDFLGIDLGAVTTLPGSLLDQHSVGKQQLRAGERKSGIDITATVPGELLSWHQTMTGDWWAKVRIEVTNRRGRDRMSLVQLVPANALHPRTRS